MAIIGKRKPGRPKKDDSKVHQIRIRLNEEEQERLNELAIRTGLNKSDVIREALDFYSLKIKYEH